MYFILPQHVLVSKAVPRYGHLKYNEIPLRMASGGRNMLEANKIYFSPTTFAHFVGCTVTYCRRVQDRDSALRQKKQLFNFLSPTRLIMFDFTLPSFWSIVWKNVDVETMRIVIFREISRGQHTSSVHGLAICEGIQPNTSNGPRVPGNHPAHIHVFSCLLSFTICLSNASFLGI